MRELAEMFRLVQIFLMLPDRDVWQAALRRSFPPLDLAFQRPQSTLHRL
jgi:hypothetical protein